MAEGVHQLWPAQVATADQGVIHTRVRTVLLAPTDGAKLRHVIIDADGRLIEDVEVDRYQINGTGVDLVLADGREMFVSQAQGCQGCGGVPSSQTVQALLATY